MADTLIAGTTLVEKESRSIGDVPIGGIVAWAKTLSGVPNLAEGWVECDGSVLVDALSPLNGQTIPDLNGDNRFLRGNATSGGTGGSATSAHSHDIPLGAGSGNELQIEENALTGGTFTAETKVTNMSSSTDPSLTRLESLSTAPENRPPYYEVVWIMRVR